MMKDSAENEKRVIKSLYPEGIGGHPRQARMRSANRTFGTFCQWCATPREPIGGYFREHRFKACPKCDTAGPDSLVSVRIGVK